MEKQPPSARNKAGPSRVVEGLERHLAPTAPDARCTVPYLPGAASRGRHEPVRYGGASLLNNSRGIRYDTSCTQPDFYSGVGRRRVVRRQRQSRTAAAALSSQPECGGGPDHGRHPRRRRQSARAAEGSAGPAGRSAAHLPTDAGVFRSRQSQPAVPVLSARYQWLRGERLHDDHPRGQRPRSAHRNRRKLWPTDGRRGAPRAGAEVWATHRPSRSARLYRRLHGHLAVVCDQQRERLV
jgi:hypothetical protein